MFNYIIFPPHYLWCCVCPNPNHVYSQHRICLCLCWMLGKLTVRQWVISLVVGDIVNSYFLHSYSNDDLL